MSQAVYLEETSYRLVERLTLAAEKIADRLELPKIKEEVLKSDMRSVKVMYDELIYAVGTKFEGESRHQTALKYIRQAENKRSEGKHD